MNERIRITEGMTIVSQIQPVSEGEFSTAIATADPRRNPSYPRRIHWGEISHWGGLLQNWSARVAEASKKLGTLSTSADREFYQLVHSQMLGAIDQMTDCTQRLPREAAALYEEDRHRMENAVAAIERLFKKWERGK